MGSVATRSGSHSETSISRSSLLESEISRDERTLLERALRAGVVCRRVSDSGERVIEIADDSILSSWTQLEQRLAQNLACIQQREALIQARRSWIASGRRISLLREVSDEVAAIEVVNERGTWLGNRSLDFLNAVKDAKAYSRREKELRDRLAASEEKLWRESEARRVLEQEVGVAQSTTDRLWELGGKEVSKAATIRQRWGIGTTALLAGVIAIGTYSFVANEKRVALNQANVALALAQAQAEQEKLIALERARTEEANRRLAMSQATQLVVYGVGLARQKQWSNASTQFSEAIRLDPTLAEAYFRRALTVKHLPNPDLRKEMEDFASFFDLAPSLSGRINLIQDITERAPENDDLLNRQLEAVLKDSANRVASNMSATAAAARLKSILDAANSRKRPLHPDVEANLRRVALQLDPKAFSAKSIKRSAIAEVEAVVGNARPAATSTSSGQPLADKSTEVAGSRPTGAPDSRPQRGETPSASTAATQNIDRSEREERSRMTNEAPSRAKYSSSKKDFFDAQFPARASQVREMPTLEPPDPRKPAK